MDYHLPTSAISVVALSVALFSSDTFGETVHPALAARHTLILGSYYQTSDPVVEASRGMNETERLNLVDLGIDDKDTDWMAGYRWRFTDRWSAVIRANVFTTKGDEEAHRTLQFNGQTFESGARVQSDFTLDTYAIDFMYSFYRNTHTELQIGAGIHAFDYDITLTGTLSVNDSTRVLRTTTDSLVAPLPNIRVHGIHVFNANWTVNTTVGWMSAKAGNWEGDYIYFNVNSEYNFNQNWRVGAGYQVVSVDVKREGKTLDSALNVSYRGPQVYLALSF